MEPQTSKNSGTQQNPQDEEIKSLEKMFEDLKLRLEIDGYENLHVERQEPNGFFLTQRTSGGWFSRGSEDLLLSVSQNGRNYLLAHVVSPEIGYIVRGHLESYRQDRGLREVIYH